MATSREGIGERVLRWRGIVGMTQQQLANAVAEHTGKPYSQAAISQVETGARPVTKRDILLALARGLGVSTTDLIGLPYQPTARTDLEMYRVVPLIRAALDEPDDPIIPRTLDGLGAAIDQAMAARMACDYLTLGTILPDVIAETRMLWRETGDVTAGELLVRACVTASLALKPGGWVDLAKILADLASATARQIDDPVCQAAADFTLAAAALAAGNRRRSLSIAMDSASRLDATGLDVPDRYAWATMLHLHASLSAASLHQGGDSAGHLAQAGVFADLVQGDPWRMEACPANVATWAVGIALENGDAGQAPSLARRVDITGLRTPQRRSRLHMDTGRAHYAEGDFDAAIRAFLAADAAAPGDLRHRPPVVELVGQMARDASTRGGSDALRALALRVGVDPFAPTESV